LPSQLPPPLASAQGAAFFTAFPLSGHLALTGPAMALTTTIKLRQPNRVPSHLIALDFMIF
ncbi:MAG: hypothetical protein OXS32_09515, partial [Verrucomicrobiales bacterium]|nr:hypothetical protein [Verrucomicrobiales bacterium]